MRGILIPGQLFGDEGPEPAAEPWPVDEHTIRVDEMFARQLDNEFSAGVRGLLEPMIDTRLDWAAGTLGRLAQRATVKVDDASVADRIAGLNRDAATSWHDPAYLRKLGRTAVDELRYQGERRGWDADETDTRVRSGLSDLYAGAVETAIGQDDLAGAASLFEHLDRQMIYEPDSFVGVDLDRHHLSLDDEDHVRFAGVQKAIAEGRIDPGLARYDRMRRGIDRAFQVQGIDTDGVVAVRARANAHDRVGSFETIEGRPLTGRDIDGIVDDEVARLGPEEPPRIPADADDKSVELQLASDNQRQNKQVRDIVVQLKLTPLQQQQLHRAISGQGMSYQEILLEAKSMFGK